MNNIDIKDVLKKLYQFGFRFLDTKSIVIIYINEKYRFKSIYYDKDNKYWTKDACIKCWCEVDLNNNIINIYNSEPELNNDETIDDIFCGYDDNRIELLISNKNIKNNIDNINIKSVKTINNISMFTLECE